MAMSFGACFGARSRGTEMVSINLRHCISLLYMVVTESDLVGKLCVPRLSLKTSILRPFFMRYTDKPSIYRSGFHNFQGIQRHSGGRT